MDLDKKRRREIMLRRAIVLAGVFVILSHPMMYELTDLLLSSIGLRTSEHAVSPSGRVVVAPTMLGLVVHGAAMFGTAVAVDRMTK